MRGDETRQDKRREEGTSREEDKVTGEEKRRGEKKKWSNYPGNYHLIPWREREREMKRDSSRHTHDLQQIHSSSFWGNIPHWTCYNKFNVSPISRPKTVIYAQPREKSRAPVSTRIQMQTKEPKTAIWQKCRQRIQHLHIHKSQSKMRRMSYQTARRRHHNTAWGGSNTIILWPFGAISKQLQFVKQA